MNSFSLNPISNKTICLVLYENVVNTKFLKTLLQKGSLPAALINANMILDAFQVLCAAAKASHAVDNGCAKTRTFFTEILFRLSPSNKISDCFNLFGVSDDSSRFLLLCEKENYTSIITQIQGDICDLSLLESICNKELIKKSYKITENELINNTLLNCVVSQMAVKEVR